MTTYEEIRKYCEEKFSTPERADTYTAAMARDELFEKEKEYGKSFFDFNADEMEEYLKNLSTSRVYKGSKKPISPSYLGQLIAYYRELFWIHMRETGVYRENILMDSRFDYSLSGRMNNDLPVFTKDTLERCCIAFDEHFEKCEADLSKLVLWLAYSGCFDYRDIFSFHDEDVDLDERAIHLKERTIRMKDECYDLVIHHHDTKEYRNYRMTNLMVPYHGSFVWVPYRATTVDLETLNEVQLFEKYREENDKRTFQRVTDLLSKKIAFLRKEQGIHVTLDLLYYRGIFDYMIKRCGYDRTMEIIQSRGNRGNADDFQELRAMLAEYGAKITDKNDIYRIKYNIGTNFIR